MKIEEIKQHLASGATGEICMYREILFPEMPHKVKSIYITGGYTIVIEFDDIDTVNSGDGWKWRSSAFALPALVAVLEDFLGKKIDDWQHVSEDAPLKARDKRFDAELVPKKSKFSKTYFIMGKHYCPNCQAAFAGKYRLSE